MPLPWFRHYWRPHQAAHHLSFTVSAMCATWQRLICLLPRQPQPPAGTSSATPHSWMPTKSQRSFRCGTSRCKQCMCCCNWLVIWLSYGCFGQLCSLLRKIANLRNPKEWPILETFDRSWPVLQHFWSKPREMVQNPIMLEPFFAESCAGVCVLTNRLREHALETSLDVSHMIGNAGTT